VIRSRPLVLVALLGAGLALAQLEVGPTAIATLVALVLAGLAMRAIASTASASPVTSASTTIRSTPGSASAPRRACGRKLASGVFRSGVELASTVNARQAANAPGKIALRTDGRRQDTFFSGTTHGRPGGGLDRTLFAQDPWVPTPGAEISPPMSPSEILEGGLEGGVEMVCLLMGCNNAWAPGENTKPTARKTFWEEVRDYGTFVFVAALGRIGRGKANAPRSTLPRDKAGNHLPDPTAEGAHTTLGTRVSSETGQPYRQGATFDAQGQFRGRTDVTNHGRADHPNPHFHPATGPGGVRPGAHPIPTPEDLGL